MGDINLEYGSTGFEKVQHELKGLEKAGSDISAWFRPAQTTLESLGSKGQGAFRQIASGAKEATGGLWDLITGLTKVTTIVTAVNGLLGGLGVYAFGRWSEGMLKATESSRTLEASLKSLLGSQEAVQKISGFAKGYAAESTTTTYSQVMEIMKTFALQPGTQPIFEMGDTGRMKQIMDIVTGLGKMFPQQGIEGGQYMLRQAIGDLWKPFQTQTGMRPEVLAQRAGMTKEEMEFSPLNTLKGFEAFTQAAPKVSTLAGLMNKLRGSYNDWLETIGNTGIYDKVLDYLKKFNDFFGKTFSGAQGKGMASAIGQVMEYMSDSISKIFTKGIEWDKITDLPGLLKTLGTIGQNIQTELVKIWDQVKESVGKAAEKALMWVASTLGQMIGKYFVPVGLAIIDGIITGIQMGITGLEKAIKEAVKAALESRSKAQEERKPAQAQITEGPGFIPEAGSLFAISGYLLKKLGLGKGALPVAGMATGAYEMLKNPEDFTKTLPASMMLGGAMGSVIPGVGTGLGMLIGGGVQTLAEFAKNPQENLKIIFDKNIWKSLWNDVVSGLKEIAGKGGKEIGKVMADEAAGAAQKWTKDRWATWRAQEAKANEPSAAPGTSPALGAPPISLEQRYKVMQSWAGMAGKIAEGGGAESPFERWGSLIKERSEMRDKWNKGELGDEEWRKYYKKSFSEETQLINVRGFQGEYMKKLEDMTKTPGVTPEFKSKLYEQMSGISLQRGETGPARDYMEKSLEALKESFKSAAERAKAQLEAEQATAKNTGELVKIWSGGKENEPEPKSQNAEVKPMEKWTGVPQDEIRYDATKGMYTNY